MPHPQIIYEIWIQFVLKERLTQKWSESVSETKQPFDLHELPWLSKNDQWPISKSIC